MNRNFAMAVAALALGACAQKADNVALDPPIQDRAAYASPAPSAPADGYAPSTSPGTAANDSRGYGEGNTAGMGANGTDFGPLPPKAPPQEPAEPTPGR